jgi:tetratricopeptide (TPR) repeat protein
VSARSALFVAFAAFVAFGAFGAAPAKGAPAGAAPAKGAPAGAAPAGATLDADARAKAAAHFKQGQAFFQREDYDHALAEYQAAFELSPEPLLYFNIALCHDRANRPEQALQAFQHYLELAPTGTVADEARDDVARLVPVVDKLVKDRADEEARRRQEAAKQEPARTRPAAVSRPSRVPRYVMVAGAAVVVIGATSHVLAWRARDRVANAPDPDAYFSDRDTFKLERGVAIGGYAVGAATLATGLVLGLVLPHREGVEVSVAATPGGAALAVGWSR